MYLPFSELITEQRNPNSIDLDLRSTEEIIEIFNEENRRVLKAIEAEAERIAPVLELITSTFRSGGSLFYIGAGTSGRLGVLDASECPPTFSTPPEMVQGIIAGGSKALRRSVEAVEDRANDGATDLRKHEITANDVVVGIASSGRTPYVLGALEEAKKIGAKTILLSCTPPEPRLKNFVDLFIVPIVGPEIITGSTRLKAGTATKLVLNMLSTIPLIRLGKVHDNLMVDVQASNEKMTDRAVRIIMEVAEVNRSVALETLERANRNAKVAIVMLRREVNVEQAVELLRSNGDSLRKVIEKVNK